ncbi:MAG: hypothetical protein V1792_26600 [Pseudomonadota bacterium]
MSTFTMLIGMVILGILSALLSYYRKNYYVRVFNDILGKEEDDNTAVKVGRGFWYGFWFLIYFSLLLSGLICLIAFLIVAGIIAAIVFVLVWVSEKILPNELAGNILVGLFEKVGLRGAPAAPEPIAKPKETFAASQQAPAEQPETPQPSDAPSGSGQEPEEPKDDSPKA